jgi:hypothetical protein
MMKKYLLPFLLIAVTQASVAQSLNYKLFRYRELGFFNKKSEILSQLGVPDSITEPQYECGFLSEAEQAKKYHSENFKNTVFTGNDEEGYLLESLLFEDGFSIRYGEFVLTARTTVADLTSILGAEWATDLEDGLNGSVVISFGEQSDDGMRFVIRNGFLQKLAYWSPC